MYDHDVPRETVTRLDRIAELLGEIRDRLPEPPKSEPERAVEDLSDLPDPEVLELREPDPLAKPPARKAAARKPATGKR